MVARRQLLAVTMAAVIAVLTFVPVGASAGPAAVPATARLADESAKPQLTVERTARQVEAGERVTYQILVTNPAAEDDYPAHVRVSLPPGLVDVTAPGGELDEHYAHWLTTVDPGATTTVHMTASYNGKDRVGPERLVLSACLLDSGATPVTCTTDLTEVGGSQMSWWWWLAGGALLIAAIAAVAAWWHRRRSGRWPRPILSAILPLRTRRPAHPAAPGDGLEATSS